MTKIHKEAALEWLWDRMKNPDEHSCKMVRHSLRTLIKAEDADGLRLLTSCTPTEST
ncbi:hypothetical protein M6D81_01060 [Paenibacillus sp. J5C_2022]|nr:hypothetical protein [Paenibacillus sp. J5C2022]